MIIGRLKELLWNENAKEWVISFTTKQNPVETFYRLKDHDLSIDMKKYYKKRSLSANAYAWVIIDKIAEVMRITKTEVYLNAIREIGGISVTTGMKTDAIPTFREIWCADHLGRRVEVIEGSKKEGWSNVRIYYGSSDFDTAQMARFIDSLIQDAESLGIPTISDEEAERMVGAWRKA